MRSIRLRFQVSVCYQNASLRLQSCTPWPMYAKNTPPSYGRSVARYGEMKPCAVRATLKDHDFPLSFTCVIRRTCGGAVYSACFGYGEQARWHKGAFQQESETEKHVQVIAFLHRMCLRTGIPEEGVTRRHVNHYNMCNTYFRRQPIQKNTSLRKNNNYLRRKNKCLSATRRDTNQRLHAYQPETFPPSG